jgi:hypothetical protein
MKLRHLTLIATALAASTALECGAVQPLDNFSVHLGGYITEFDTEVRADGQGGDGTSVDLNRDLGLDSSDIIATIGATWRPWQNHEFGLSYYQDDGSASRRIDREIEFDGTVYPISSTLRGLIWYSMEVGLSLEVDSNGNDVGGTIGSSVDADLPAPTIGGSWRWVPGGSDWRLSADLGYFSADIDGVDADVTYGRVGVEWFPWEQAGISLDYTARQIEASAEGSRFDGNFDFVDSGLRLGVVYRF